ncbi:MAG: hypothetical protein ACFE0R_00425 [Salinarimonas sp.]
MAPDSDDGGKRDEEATREDATRLSEQDLIEGGLEPITAYVFRKAGGKRAPKSAAARQHSYRETKKSEGLEQVNRKRYERPVLGVILTRSAGSAP